MKDKLIKCLLSCDNYEGDVKFLTQKYLEIYGKDEGFNLMDREKIKVILYQYLGTGNKHFKMSQSIWHIPKDKLKNYLQTELDTKWLGNGCIRLYRLTQSKDHSFKDQLLISVVILSKLQTSLKLRHHKFILYLSLSFSIFFKFNFFIFSSIRCG